MFSIYPSGLYDTDTGNTLGISLLFMDIEDVIGGVYYDRHNPSKGGYKCTT